MRVFLAAFLALSLCSCVTQNQLDGIAAKAKIPNECRFVGHTPQIADLSTDANLKKVVDAMGGGNVIIVSGHHYNQGLLALANTWWGDLYDCDTPSRYHGADITIVSYSPSHPVTSQSRAIDNSVRVTSNPEVVRGCQFLTNVSDLARGQVTNGQYPVQQVVMKQNAAEVGGNTVFLSTDPHTGEAYSCAVAHVEASQVVQPSLEESKKASFPEIHEMQSSGLLVKIDSLKHLAYVRREPWLSLSATERKDRAMVMAEFCAASGGGMVSIRIFDDATGQQVGAVGDAPK